ncbi:hypothetical protein ARMGADRAFT_1059839 [Armillaria gallica]|uniref:Uncharacterized protein n=1 Tax=Armillaria gallica TaxID=47427 RepID=A0A2H3EHY0_ARMGA|nr:hypothetical protein ARMGADRAFT_1059839 [Armillaria gallica]
MEQSPRQIPLIYSAALAALSHFRSVNVLVAFDGDLAWYLLRAIRSPRWRLDVHIEGDCATLFFAIKSLAKTDRCFRIETMDDSRKYAFLVYTADLQNATGIDLIDDEPPNVKEHLSQRHVDYCRVFFNCGLVGAHNFLVVQPDYIPLLPFQLLLQYRMRGYLSSCLSESRKKLNDRMAQDVAAMNGYFDLQGKDANREPWLISPPQRRHLLQFLTDICIFHPHAIPIFARYLSLLPPGYAYLPSIARRGRPQAPPFNAYLPLTKIPIAVMRLPGDTHKVTMQSRLLMSALHDLSARIRELGYACYLNGPGDIPWYVLGSPQVPLVHCCIRYMVIPVHVGLKADELREQLCKDGLLKKRPSGDVPPCKVVIEEPQSGFHPEAEMGITMDGIALYIPAQLVFDKLSMMRTGNMLYRRRGDKLSEWDRISPGITAL